MSAFVLKFTVFVNVTGRIPQLDHRSISQYKTSIPPCVCRIVQHLQEMYTSLYCSTDRYDDVCMASQWRRILIRLKIQQEQIRRGVFRAQTKSSSEHACEVINSNSLRISLVFYWFLTTADAVFLSDFSGPRWPLPNTPMVEGSASRTEKSLRNTIYADLCRFRVIMPALPQTMWLC